MSDKFTGTTVDIYSVAKNRQKINTKIALAQMPELCEFLHEPDLATELEVEITGIEGAKGLPAALEVRAEVYAVVAGVLPALLKAGLVSFGDEFV